MKHFFLFSIIALLLSSCIGERLECSGAFYNVKNQMQDSILVTFSSPEKGIRRDTFVIEPRGKEMVSSCGYQCLDNGGDIKKGTAEGGFICLKNNLIKRHLTIYTMSGDTLADFSPSSSIYDRENWILNMDENYDVDCTLILTEELLKTARR